MERRKNLLMSIMSIVLAIMLFLTGTILSKSVFPQNEVLLVQAERTIDLSEDILEDPDILEEFYEIEFQGMETGFKITAVKHFEPEVSNELGLIEPTDDYFSVYYVVEYVDNEGTMFVSVYSPEVPELCIDTVPGLLSYNLEGETDVILEITSEADEMENVTDDEINSEITYEYLWLSELTQASLIDSVGWFNDLIKNVMDSLVSVALQITRAATKLLTKVAIALFGEDNAAHYSGTILDMYADRDDIYHADFDCWQQYFGYCTFYDAVFNAGTSMENAIFDFDVNTDGVMDYVIWAWKGDYLTLGAGAELGIYKRWRHSDFWVVDKKLASTMTLQLDYQGNKIIDWEPEDRQWWITGFNSRIKDVLSDELTVVFTVCFDMIGSIYYDGVWYTSTQLYNACKNRWENVDSRISFSTDQMVYIQF